MSAIQSPLSTCGSVFRKTGCGPRALDRLLGQTAADVEELSYVPEIAYRYGRNAAGYAALMRLTERHTNADLMCALRHRMAHDAHDANRGQQQRQHGEPAEQEHGEAPRTCRVMDDVFHGIDAGHRPVRQDTRQGFLDRRGERGRRVDRADDNGPGSAHLRPLPPR